MEEHKRILNLLNNRMEGLGVEYEEARDLLRELRNAIQEDSALGEIRIIRALGLDLVEIATKAKVGKDLAKKSKELREVLDSLV